MSLSVAFWLLKIVFLLGLLGFGATLLYVDPERVTWARPAFYGSLFVFVWSAGALFLLALRKRVLGLDQANTQKSESVRQGLWLAFLASGLLFLQEGRYLTWWDGLLLLAALLLVELYFLGKRRPESDEH